MVVGTAGADTIIIVHIPASHDQVYMISLPRDLEVAIPDFPPTGFTAPVTGAVVPLRRPRRCGAGAYAALGTGAGHGN